MSKGIFITGTGTDIGKTYVTALIVKKLRDLGLNACYFKAAVSGNEKNNNVLIPGDAEYISKVANIKEDLSKMVPYVYENAVSPHLASQIEGNPVDMDVVKKYYKNISEKYDYIVMEGSGGIVCPIRFDKKKIWLVDIIKELSLDTIVVADAGLGTINNVVLTIEYMKQRNINVRGIILNHYNKGNLMEEDNKKMIEYCTNIPVIACVGKDEKEINIDIKNIL